MRFTIRLAVLTLSALAGSTAAASADVSVIAFNGSAEAGGRKIQGAYAMPATGGEAKLLVPGAGGAVALAPDGKRIAYVGDDFSVDISNLDGGNPRVVLPLDESSNNFYGRFGFGPSSLSFGVVDPATNRATALTLIDADGTNRRVIHTVPAGFEAGSSAISADGSRVAYGQFAGEGGVGALSGIVVVGADGSNPVQLTSGTSDGDPSFSRDGTKIAFTRCFGFGAASQCDILVTTANGASTVNLTKTSDLSEGYPVFSPDGSQIAFEVAEQIIPIEGGNFNRIPARIDVINADGTGRVDFTGALPGEEFAPSWANVAALPDLCKNAKGKLKKAKKKLAKLKKKDASAGALKKAKKKVKQAKEDAKEVC